MMRPVAHVARVDERPQLGPAADELAAGAIAPARPLDRELDVLGHELERRVRIRPVERLEVALEEAHAATLGRSRASGATPIRARLRSVKNSAMRLRATMPFGRYQCQMLL